MVRVPSAIASLSDGYKSLTISFKGFEPSEFLGHIQALWPKMTNYADHQLLEQQANLRLYSLQLTAPSCEILDDIALHMQRIGYSLDEQIACDHDRASYLRREAFEGASPIK